MNRSLVITNRQRTFAVDARCLRRLVRLLLEAVPGVKEFDLGIHLVDTREMTRLNETYLRHEGPTDVITFGYGPGMMGEIFICPDVAGVEARRFRTSWQNEIARYVVHGVLHLLGFDDRRAADRRRMKREEDRLVRELNRRLKVSKLARRRETRAGKGRGGKPGFEHD